MDSLSLRVLGVDVGISCEDDSTRELLAAHYDRMRVPPAGAHVTYRVSGVNEDLVLARDGRTPVGVARHPGEVVFLLDQDLILEVQRHRTELYFIHAAVLVWAGRTVMLVAEPGGGKSTTAWALVHHGFRYLSDELAPVDLSTLVVHPYLRALTLKSRPPRAYPLPEGAVLTARGFHIPAAALPSGVRSAPSRLTAMFFLRYRPGAEPQIRGLSVAEASARLYANALNPLAHAEDGLDAAIHIASESACFDLVTNDLPATCALVLATLHGLPARVGGPV